MIDRSCCKDDSRDPNDPQDCLAKWKAEQEDVCNEYDTLLATTNSFHDAYMNSYTWENKLKRWMELAKTTDEKAGEVVNTLQFFSDQISVVCTNSICTVEALQRIICLVKVIFNTFYTFDDDNNGLKDDITEFKTEIKCSSASDEDKKDVLECIELYESKIKLVCELQATILSKLLETLKCAIQLDTFFCHESGLKKKIITIIDDFEKGLPEDEKCGHGHMDNDNGDSDTNEFPCNPDKVKPKPIFRIGDDNEYYIELEEAYQKAINRTKSLRDDWIDSKKKSDKMQSKKTSIKEAIRAAEAAENGK